MQRSAQQRFELVVIDEVFSAESGEAMRGSDAVRLIRQREAEAAPAVGQSARHRAAIISCTANANLAEEAKALHAAGADAVR